HFSLADPVCLEPMQFGAAHRAVVESNRGVSLQLSPSALTIPLPQHGEKTHAPSSSDDCCVADGTDHRKRHCQIRTCEPRDTKLARCGEGQKLPVGGGLNSVEVGVLTALGHQLVVGSHFDEPRAVEYDDEVGHAHRGKAVRHQDGDASAVAGWCVSVSIP